MEHISDAPIDESATLDSKTMNEKTVPAHFTEDEQHDQSSQEQPLQEEILDLYKPFPVAEGTPLEDQILTIRAVAVGIVLGSLVSASNLYLGIVVDYYLPMNPQS